MHIFLDIETIPTQDDAIIAEIRASVQPPATLTKEDSIARWNQDKRAAAEEQAIRKTAFDGTYGSVICVQMAVNDEEVFGFARGHNQDRLTERDLLESVARYTEIDAFAVGHNIAWDVRFLWQRMVIHRVKPLLWIKTALRAKPWDSVDTMTMWHSERDRRISLDKLCRALGVDSPKSEMDGSMVYDYWLAGRIDDIVRYCSADVEAARECYRRMRT